MMKKALTKPLNFSLKKGNKPWVNISMQIAPEHIHIMAQPAGALYAALIRNDAKYIPDARKLLFGKTLVEILVQVLLIFMVLRIVRLYVVNP